MELLFALEHDRALRRERVFKDPLDPLSVSDEHLLRYYRFPRRDILWLCNELNPIIGCVTRRSHAVPTHTKVLVALRFYASGTFQSVVGDATGLSQTSVSRIIDKVTAVLYTRARREIKMPRGVQEITQTKQAFHRIRNFPNIIGAIDGTHIPIKAPVMNEDVYVNRKRYHSLNVQVVVNADQLVTSYCAKFPGSTHDSFIWANCDLRRRFVNGEFGNSYLLGDSGYPLLPYMMTPIANPTNPQEERYNRSHMRTRVIVEQTFGEIKSRFRCLHKSGGSLQYVPEKCAKITVVCLLLHNYCIKRRIPLPAEDFINEEDDPDDPPQDHAAIGDNIHHGRAERLELLRTAFAH